MENIITELIDILKSHSTVLAKRKSSRGFLDERNQENCRSSTWTGRWFFDWRTKRKRFPDREKNIRTVVTMIGEIRFKRRCYITPNGSAVSPLDEFMGWTKYNRYSTLVVRNLSELATKLSYCCSYWVLPLRQPMQLAMFQTGTSNQLLQQQTKMLFPSTK